MNIKYFLKLTFKEKISLFLFKINFIIIKLKCFFNKINTLNSNKKSDLEIDIVITVIERDSEVLDYTLSSIKKYIQHPINKIYIVSPYNSKKIKEICKKNKCYFIDENKVLPITKKDINYKINWIDRSWRIYQQLLKWWMQEIVEKENFLITESEAVFIRNRIFEYKWKYIFPCSNFRIHKPYIEIFKKLTNIKIHPLYNFTSHHALYNKKYLRELKFIIENNCNEEWYKAIINNLSDTEMSSVSDYENYWQFMYKKYKNKIFLENWGNIDLKRNNLSKLKELKKKYKKTKKVISFSYYLN